MPSATPACIYVLAGTNGSGKSSIGGAMFRESGSDVFDPDRVARRLLDADPTLDQSEANSRAWLQGKRLLERSIAEGLSFAFETTLGGTTIRDLLEQAPASGAEVRVWYVGLEGVDLHVKRVRARVRKGGHDIPEQDIRGRYDTSRANLIRLMPLLTELRVYDNSRDADPDAGAAPEPVLLLHVVRAKVTYQCRLEKTPEWAKPILTAAMKLKATR